MTSDYWKATVEILTPIWDGLIVEPVLNGLVLFYGLLGNNFVLATVLMTVLIRVVTWPLMKKQMDSSKKMQQLQKSEEWQGIQKKYGKDREKLSQEQMRLYRENGVNPAGGCLPLVIQMPILFAFYQAITLLLAVNPESLLQLARHLYRAVPFLSEIARQAVPINNQFLWLNLALPDPYYILPVVTALSTWIQQRMTPMTTGDPSQASMGQSMQIFMPLFIGYITLNFPSGLAVYWIASTVVGIVIQGVQYGWSGILPSRPVLKPATVQVAIERGSSDNGITAKPRSQRQNRRRGNR